MGNSWLEGVGKDALRACLGNDILASQTSKCPHACPPCQITNEAAKYRFRSGGEFDVGGLTIRTPYGRGGL